MPYKRKLPPGTFGLLESRQAKVEPSGKYGALTPVRPAACAMGNWIFVCDCGNTVTLVARGVIKRAAGGAFVRCSVGCTAKRPTTEGAANP